jgi:uncharacterized membrane protein SpoIIM required for sporulation
MLYRAVTSDLALTRRDYPGQQIVSYLNQLLTRTHSYIYQQDVSDLRGALRYFTTTLPRTFRQTWLFTLVAFLLFIVPGILAYRIGYVNPESAALAFDLEEERQTLAERDVWTDIPINRRPYASAFIMGNNIRVAILAFGGGVAFGLFTIYMLIANGLILGGVLGIASHYGMIDPLLKFIVGHGVIELSVIFIAGGAGLQLGWALVNPGRYRRLDALALSARKVLILVVAAIPLLIIAGLIEGFFSPTDSPFVLHLAVGVVSGLVLYSYLLLTGWTIRQNRAAKPISSLANDAG